MWRSSGRQQANERGKTDREREREATSWAGGADNTPARGIPSCERNADERYRNRPRPSTQAAGEARPVRPAGSRPEGNGPGVVRITVGKEHADYFLTLIPADFGRGFKVEKIGLTCSEPAYAVNIDGDTKTCECKGFCVTGTASTRTASRP